MSEPIKVEKFGLKTSVNPEFLAENQDRVEGMLEATLIAQAEAKGYVVLPDSFEVTFREPNYLFSEQEEGGLTTRDYLTAFASVRCYKKPAQIVGNLS
jgi:hypothetical protein